MAFNRKGAESICAKWTVSKSCSHFDYNIIIYALEQNINFLFEELLSKKLLKNPKKLEQTLFLIAMDAVGGFIKAQDDKFGYGKFKNVKDVFKHVVDLLEYKGRDYSGKNVAMTGLVGVATRLMDKVYRLENLVLNDKKPTNEPTVDTWQDIVGYAIIGEMVREKLWWSGEEKAKK